MVHHADRGREALLDAAEELFATLGIDAVSNRRIAEHAGNANHSAVTYHFGSRDELIRVLLERDAERMRHRRAELAEALTADATLPEVLATRVLPWIEVLDGLPHPSWRARFLNQVRTVVSLSEPMRTIASDVAGLDELLPQPWPGGGEVPFETLRHRSAMLAVMFLGACADFEQRRENGTAEGDWFDIGYFLIDAAAGMLAAPVSARGTLSLHPEPPR